MPGLASSRGGKSVAGWVGGRKRLTFANALPDVDATTAGIPDTALAVDGPVYIQLPDSRRVADDYTRHV